MIDLHTHILPGIDDGARDLETSLEMARIAVADGTRLLACTPHINPPIYNNNTQNITGATAALQEQLDNNGIELGLIVGADIHLTANLLQTLQDGTAPTIAGSRYLLLEPSHDVMPPHIDRFCATVIEHGYTPVLTHPERLIWINQHYDVICNLDALGMVMQLTAGSITGQFGKTVQYWADRMLAEGRVDIIASDAHDTRHRPPVLSNCREIIEQRHGTGLATTLMIDNPKAIVENLPIAPRQRPVALEASPKRGFFDMIRGR
jgi:protein-tyrosine phosphatase